MTTEIYVSNVCVHFDVSLLGYRQLPHSLPFEATAAVPCVGVLIVLLQGLGNGHLFRW